MAKQRQYENKYGFVYIWFDKKHTRYYIGCHWGYVDDGYICSSRWMRQAYRKRPSDFKRRIIVSNIIDRAQLYLEEYRYLQMIDPKQFGKRYYNVSAIHPHHWSTDEAKTQKIKKSASEQMKAQHQDPEYRAKYMASREALKNRKKTPEQIEQHRQAMVKAMADKYPIEERQNTLYEQGKRYRDNNKEACKARDKRMYEARKLRKAKKIGDQSLL